MFVVYFVVISSSISKYQLQNTKCSSGISLPSTAEISVTVTQKTATSNRISLIPNLVSVIKTWRNME